MKTLVFGFYVVVVVIAMLSNGCSQKPVKPTEEPKAMATNDTSLSAKVTSDSISLDSKGSDGGNILGLSTVHFAFDKASLDPSEKDLLKKNVDWINDHPSLKIQIEGHCDQRGSVEYNLALGERRAKSVVEYLSRLGVPKEKLLFISYGKERPIVSGDSIEDMAKNRRANFVPIK